MKSFVVLLSFLVSVSFGQNANQYASSFRPCPNLNPNCIGQYLASKSYCRIPNRATAREPFYAPIRRVELQSINATLFRHDVTYSNVLSGRIEEFFVDYESGLTVLSVDYRNLTINIRADHYETNRRGNVPQFEIHPVLLVYPEVAVTTVFPSTNVLDLASTRNTGFFQVDPLSDVGYFGPAVEADYANFRTTSPQAFFTTAPLVNRFFIQNLLCDYGIQPNQLGLRN